MQTSRITFTQKSQEKHTKQNWAKRTIGNCTSVVHKVYDKEDASDRERRLSFIWWGSRIGYILENERNILFYPFKERISKSLMLPREMLPLHQLWHGKWFLWIRLPMVLFKLAASRYGRLFWGSIWKKMMQ